MLLLHNYKLYRHTRSSIFFYLLLFGTVVSAQTLPVSNQMMQDYMRNRQLDGTLDSNISLTVRPLALNVLNKGEKHSGSSWLTKNLLGDSDVFQVILLPFTFDQQFNSSYAYGRNDGLMIPAKGYQHYVSGGVFLKAGPLTIQAAPEFLYAANPKYLNGNDQIAADRYTSYISLSGYGADLPDYYETPNFKTLGIGQSSVRLNFGPASIGVSNENLAWGPGRKNSLIMGNTARGFKHLTLNTTRPVETLLGSFEGQILAGRLENSSSTLNALKLNEWRYLSGMVLNYQPKWVPGLFIGLTRAFQIYNTDIEGFGDYIPLFQTFEKKKTNEDFKRRDQLTSVFARFLFSEAHAEVYAEFARNDHSFDIRDFAQEPQHSRAYLFGFQKMVFLAGNNDRFLISGEVTHLAQPLNRVLRSSGTWYVHNINQGYTNAGEILGAGIGPGGGSQTFEFSWLSGFKKLGVQIERFEHNRDYYQQVIDPQDNYNEQWVDLSAGLLANWDFKNLLIRGQLTGVQSLNYLWQTGVNGLPKRNEFNAHASLGLYYYFK